MPQAVRARAWRLLGDLYLEGPTARQLPVLRGLPGPGEHLPDPFDADEAGALHHRLFGIEVLPWASVFIERDGMLGGEVTEAAGLAFTRAGLEPPAPGEAPDHLGWQLRLLSALTARGDEASATRLLTGQLLWWLPVFVHSAARHASPFWRSVLDLTLDAALDQAAEAAFRQPGQVAEACAAEPDEAAPPGSLALPVTDPLGVIEGGLGEVARHTVTPSRGGMFLALGDIRALGRARDVPAGFGRRTQVMGNLLRSAAAYGELDGVAAGLARLANEQEAFLGRVPERYRQPWIERLAGLRAVLDGLSRRA